MSQDAEDPATAIAKEIAKQLPVRDAYEDGLAPSIREAGDTLEDLTKTLRLVLAPVQYLAALQDRYKAFLDRSIRKVPEAQRTAPPPQILGPVLEGIRYEPEDTPIDEMFNELLSRSIDRKRANEAHPSYPLLIRQLSPDEAKILARLLVSRYDYEATKQLDRTTRTFHDHSIKIDELPRDGLVFPENVSFYMQHLNQLGLAGIFQKGNQQPIMAPTGEQTGIRIIGRYELTELGERFVRACTSNEPQGTSEPGNEQPKN